MVIHASYEDYLYILVGIVWVIFSYYNAQKKKKAKESQGPVKNKKPSFFETLIDEFGSKNEENAVVYSDPYHETGDFSEKTEGYSDEVIAIDNQGDVAFSSDDSYEESNYQATSAVNNEKLSRKQYNVTITDTVTKSTNNKVKNVDLKKAIIYSEMLKKKYF